MRRRCRLSPGEEEGRRPPEREAPEGGPDPEDAVSEENLRPGEVRKTFMGHLLELRGRIFACIFVCLLMTGASWFFYDRISQFLMKPLKDYNATVGPEEKVEVFTIRPTEAFITVLRIGVLGGILLAFPFIVQQTWAFVSPGLYPQERRAILPIFAIGAFFFAGGVYFSYRLVLPFAIRYLYSFAPRMGASPKVALDLYVRFVLMIFLAFGISFETPLVILALARVGLVTAGWLLRRWRYIFVGAFVVGAFLTPPDVVTQLMMAGSLIVLYFLSVIFAAVAYRKRKPGLGRRFRWPLESGEHGEV